MKKNLCQSWYTVLACLVVLGLLSVACGDTQENLTIGLLIESAAAEPIGEAFKAGMTELGYVEGTDVIYIYNSPTRSDVTTIDAEIKKLLDQEVDLFFVTGVLPAQRAKQAVENTDIPVIFAPAHNVVENGLVESINHPGGNLTGVRAGQEMAKSLEWLVKITPDAHKFYAPYNPADEISGGLLAIASQAAPKLGIEIVLGEVNSVDAAITAIENLPEDIDAIFRVPSPTLESRNAELNQAAIKRGLPMGGAVDMSETMLLTMAIDSVGIGKQAARLAYQTQQGVKPADLPVEQARLKLTINLKIAEAIGLDIPDDILRQANEIIRD